MIFFSNMKQLIPWIPWNIYSFVCCNYNPYFVWFAFWFFWTTIWLSNWWWWRWKCWQVNWWCWIWWERQDLILSIFQRKTVKSMMNFQLQQSTMSQLRYPRPCIVQRMQRWIPTSLRTQHRGTCWPPKGPVLMLNQTREEQCLSRERRCNEWQAFGMEIISRRRKHWWTWN